VLDSSVGDRGFEPRSDQTNLISGVQVSVLDSSVGDRGYEPRSGQTNLISGVHVSVLDSSVGDRGFEPRYGQTKYCRIDAYCFSAKSCMQFEGVAQNRDNVSELGNMSTGVLLFH
jgi:hypothetical protein